MQNSDENQDIVEISRNPFFRWKKSRPGNYHPPPSESSQGWLSKSQRKTQGLKNCRADSHQRVVTTESQGSRVLLLQTANLKGTHLCANADSALDFLVGGARVHTNLLTAPGLGVLSEMTQPNYCI